MPFNSSRQSHWFILLGLLLFLFGLLTGFAAPSFANPRMGLSAHLEALMNGIFLAVLGLVWPRVALGAKGSLAAFWLVVYASFANWLAVLLSAMWGAGAPMMPLAGGTMTGSNAQETVIKLLLVTLSLAMVAGVAMIIWGLWRSRAEFAR